MKQQAPIAMLVVCASVSLLGALFMATGLLGLLQAEQSRIEAERLYRFAVADLFKALGGSSSVNKKD